VKESDLSEVFIMNAVTVETGSAHTTTYGGLIDAIGGIAAGVLAIIGLTGFDPEGMAGIATIVLGAAFLVQTSAILSEYTHTLQQIGVAGWATNQVAGAEGLTAMFLAGAGGIVLGVLALLGIASATLIAIALIAYGSALVLSGSSVRQLYLLRGALLSGRTGYELLTGQLAAGSAGVQLISGLAAVVLGILAVAGHSARLLTLAALLVLGVTVLLSGGALSSLVMSFVQPAQGTPGTTRRTA
jgi:hypothetical protein